MAILGRERSRGFFWNRTRQPSFGVYNGGMSQSTNEAIALALSSPARHELLGQFLIAKMRKCQERIEASERTMREQCITPYDDFGKRELEKIREAEIILDCFLFRFRDIHRQITGTTL